MDSRYGIDQRARPARPMATLGVLLGILVLVVVGAALVGGSPPDERHGAIPPTVPSGSPRWVYASIVPSEPPVDETPGPPPSPPSNADGAVLPFTSSRYGYSLRIPEGWQLSASAARSWTQARPWRDGETDTFTRVDRPEVRFEIAAHALPADMSHGGFLAAFVSTQTDAQLNQQCGYNGGPILGPYIGGASTKWVRIEGARDAMWARGGCDRIDAVVFQDDAAFVMSLLGSRMLLYVFERMFMGIDFDPPAAAAVESQRYGYRLRVPGDWTSTLASHSWSGDDRPIGTTADAFVGPVALGTPRLTIAAQARQNEISEDRFTADVAPLPTAVRIDGPTVTCAFGDTVVERGPVPSAWDSEVIGGHPARVRAMCGTVDAVVFVGDRGYLFTLESGHSTRGDLERFHDLVASVSFDDGRETFVSNDYGYSVRYPGDWQVSPAPTPWAGDPSGDRGKDIISSSGRPRLRFTVAAHPAPASMTQDQWVKVHVPVARPNCGTGLIVPKPDLRWQVATIDGRSAILRSACSRVDAVVFANGLGYWLRLSTSERRPDGDLAAFNLFADSLDLDAVPPTFIAETSKIIDATDVLSPTPSPAATVSPTPTSDPRRVDHLPLEPLWLRHHPPEELDSELGHAVVDRREALGHDRGQMRSLVRMASASTSLRSPSPAGMSQATWLDSYVPWPAALERQGAHEGFCTKDHARLPVSSTVVAVAGDDDRWPAG